MPAQTRREGLIARQQAIKDAALRQLKSRVGDELAESGYVTGEMSDASALVAGIGANIRCRNGGGGAGLGGDHGFHAGSGNPQ